MNAQLLTLSRYRLEKARHEIQSGTILLEETLYNQAVGRAYYAIFHGMRAVLALDEFDSKKHSGVIAYFNQHYIHTERFEKKYGRIIKDAEMLRNDSDYKDFFEADETVARQQIEQAQEFVAAIERYLNKVYHQV